MPIINNLAGGEVEITKLADVLTGTDYDITDVYYGDKQVFTVWGESEGALPLTFNANGDNAVEWQVYGNASGVGQKIRISASDALNGFTGEGVDTLDLSTGIIRRFVRKKIFDGTETWGKDSTSFYNDNPIYGTAILSQWHNIQCSSHFIFEPSILAQNLTNDHFYVYRDGARLRIRTNVANDIADFKTWLSAQYANGTPLTIWFVSEEYSEQVSVPQDMVGTLNGYTIQSTTPSPTTPIYPIVNGDKRSDGTYLVDSKQYEVPMTTYSAVKTTPTLYIGNISSSGSNTTDDTAIRTGYIAVAESQEWLVKTDGTIFLEKIVFYTENTYKETITLTDNLPTVYKFTVPSSSKNVKLVFRASNVAPYPTILSITPYTSSFKLALAEDALSLYIGDSQLQPDEYTSYKDQKIYKYVSGVLTPTDPPVPIPALPTLNGVTVVDTELASSEVQPEKAFVKFRKMNS